VHRGKNDTPYTQIHDRSLSWLGIGSSIKGGGVKLVLWIQTIPPSETMQPRTWPPTCEQNANHHIQPGEQRCHKE